MTIPINPVDARPGGFIPGGAPPDFWSQVLAALPQGTQAGVAGYEQQKIDSRNSMEVQIRRDELALQREHLKLAQKTEETKQAQLAHAQSIADSQGKATLEFLKNVLPHAVQAGAAQQMLGQQAAPQPQDQFGIPQGLPFQRAMPSVSGLPAQPQPTLSRPAPPLPNQNDTSHADPFDAIASVIPNMPPEAVMGMVQHLEPILALLSKKDAKSEGQAVQTGRGVTTFIPGKGFYDPTANGGQGGYVPYVERGMNLDEKALKELQLQEARERLDATVAYRQEMQGRVLTQQFNQRTKDLRGRGAMLQQAALTLQQAGDNKLLTSSAIANFIQGADQKAQLRYQMLQYFKKNVDPSFTGSLTNAASLLLTGKYPDSVYQGLRAHIESLLQQSRKEFDAQRAAEVKRHPDLAGWLPEADEFFSNDFAAPVAPTGAGPVIP